MNLLHRSFCVCLAFSAISLLAQEPKTGDASTAVGSKAESLTADFQALRQQLDTQKATPEQRIAAMDEWRKRNGSPLAALRSARTPAIPTRPAAELIARQKQAALSLVGSDVEKELAELEVDVAEAVAEMRSYVLPPEKRIQMFDEFRRNNTEAFQAIRKLRKAISDRKLENAPPLVAVHPAPRSPAEIALLERRNTILEQITSKRNASNQLPPEEQIAAMDRDRAFFKERIDALRALGRQMQIFLRGQTNEPTTNSR